MQTLDTQNVTKAKEQRVLSDSYEREINFSTSLRTNSTTRDTLKSFADAGFNLADVVAGLSGATALTEQQKTVFKEHQEKSAAINRAETALLKSEELGDDKRISQSRRAVQEARQAYEKFLDTAEESLREIGKIIDSHESELQERLQTLDTSDPQRIRNEQRIVETRNDYLEYAKEHQSLLSAKNLSPEMLEDRSEELARRKGAYEDAIDTERKREEIQKAQALAAEQGTESIPNILTHPSVPDERIDVPRQDQAVLPPAVLPPREQDTLALRERFMPKFKPLDAAEVKKAFQDVNEYAFQKTKKTDFVKAMMTRQGLFRSNAEILYDKLAEEQERYAKVTKQGNMNYYRNTARGMNYDSVITEFDNIRKSDKKYQWAEQRQASVFPTAEEFPSFVALHSDTNGVYGIDLSSPNPLGVSAWTLLDPKANDPLTVYQSIEPLNWSVRGTESLYTDVLQVGASSWTGMSADTEMLFPSLKTLQLNVDKLEIGGVPVWRPEVPDATVSRALATQHAGFGHQ
jgi:hypothetical protein